MTDIKELNCALAVALGISAESLNRVGRVTLVIEPMELPKVTVEMDLFDSGPLKTLAQAYSLKPTVGESPVAGTPKTGP